MSTPKDVVRTFANWLMPQTVASIRRVRAARVAARAEAEQWEPRIRDVLACPDNRRLSRHPDAGRVIGGLQTMFNGVRVVVDGYYGKHVTEILRLNKGSHEPQEELVFSDVLSRLEPGACMLECGAYWGFYSLWFARDIPRSRVWLIEPDGANLEVGRRNFAANGLKAEFTQALVGRDSAEVAPSRICVDDFVARNNIERLHILHADIQGAEVDMLHGAARTLSAEDVDFVFISTHGEELHHECVRMLQEFGYAVPVSIRPVESFSFDGLLVAHRSGLLKSPLPMPSLKAARTVA